MRLDELIAGLPIEPHGAVGPVSDIDILGLTHDSRLVEPGDLFVAWRGEKHPGARFAQDARGRGAVALLFDEAPREVAGGPCLLTRDPRRLLGELASRLYGRPDREIRLVGVTGTNGKSTVVRLLADMLERGGSPCAELGTLGYRFSATAIDAPRTTPEASDLFRMLRSFVDQGARAAVMEVSSHALVQGRVSAAGYDAAVFLNLTRDHLDFHGDLETYFDAKKELFSLRVADGVGVVNVDDGWGARLATELADIVTFGAEGDVRYRELAIDGHGIRGEVEGPGGRLHFETSLLGAYNAENVLAAIAAARALGIDSDAIAASLASQMPIDGRMHPVAAGQSFPVVVDYAHTPEALRSALIAMRGLGDHRLIVVFGCGGGRDRGKRAPMGAIAAQLADVAILTSDNPRDEDPTAILRQVEAGMAGGTATVEILEDRREAIHRAIELATPDSAVLIAGKGHERYQTIGAKSFPFVDRDEAIVALEGRFGETRHP